MRFGSVCSGIEAASVAWHPLGWQAAWFSEIEPFPCAVLAHHYPEVSNHGDMTGLPQLIRSGKVEAPDLFCGGTPCQAFSVAGLRRSLDDARGNLSLTFCEIANAIDAVRLARGELPAVVFWENVPGVLSTADNAFGCFLAGLAGDDQPAVAPRGKWKAAGVVVGPERLAAWRVLDAQFFGVAQRRRRVFVVSVSLRHPRAWAIAESILPLVEGMQRNPPARGKTTEGAARGAAAGAGGDVVGALYAGCGPNGHGGSGLATLQGAVQGHLQAFGGNRTSGSIEVAPALLAQPGSGWKGDFESETFVTQPVTFAKTHKPMSETDPEGWSPVDAAPTITHWPRDRSDAGTDVEVVQATTFSITPASGQGAQLRAVEVDVASGISAVTMGEATDRGIRVVEPVLAPTLTASNDPSRSPQSSEITAQVAAIAASAMQVRRLTPTECERLMGFPDSYTAIPWRGKPASECPDGPRYKALGNSWAVPCARWIGRRIAAQIA